MTTLLVPHQKIDPRVAELERDALAKRGTDNQRQRYAAGLLPEDELLCIARAELFAPFTDLTQWHNQRHLRPQSVRHKSRMCHGRITFETCEPTDLDHDQWLELAKVRAGGELASRHDWVTRSVAFAAAGRDVVIIEPVTHWATCASCGAEEMRASAKVHISWAGRVLTREYAL